jgi:peptidoglycan/LPS O-acetylase OafA/YrhL
MERAVKRKPEIMAMNVFLCMLVIFIHVTSEPVTAYSKTSLQYAAVFLPWRFSSFAVHGYIFLSGARMFLGKGGAGISYGKFYRSRLARVVLPYIIWNLIYYVYFVLRGYFPFSLPELGLYIVRGDLVGPFYFIVVIVQFYALAPLWLALVRKANAAAALVAAAAVTFLLGQFLPGLVALAVPGAVFKFNDRIFTSYLFFWLAGCFAGAQYDRALVWISVKRRLVVAAFALFGLCDLSLSYVSFSGGLYFGWLGMIHVIYCAAAVFFFFMLFSYAYRVRDMTSRLALGLDAAAYSVYLVHCLVIFLVGDALRLLGVTGVSLAYGIRLAAVYPATLALCLLWKQAVIRGKRRLSAKRRQPALKP